jgi:DNA-binding Xre family transcriptional regulator
MPIQWNLKRWLALERDITRPTQLQRLLRERAGVELSLQAVMKLMKGTPRKLTLQTMQALCDALDCDLNDFLRVRADPLRRVVPMNAGQPRRLHGRRAAHAPAEVLGESPYPDPGEFLRRMREYAERQAG